MVMILVSIERYYKALSQYMHSICLKQIPDREIRGKKSGKSENFGDLRGGSKFEKILEIEFFSNCLQNLSVV